MSQSMPEVTEFDDRIVVEAPSAEAALEAVTERLGTRARIAKVEHVRRGGVAGFFARELVQVVATPRTGVTPPADRRSASQTVDNTHAPTTPSAAVPSGPRSEDASDALDALAGIDFASVLRQHLPADSPAPATEDGPRAETAPPAPVNTTGDPSRADVAAPATRVERTPSSADAAIRDAGRPAGVATNDVRPADRRAAGTTSRLHSSAPQQPGTPRWTVDNLCRLGLPRPLLEAVAGLEPTDDAGWTYALARCLERLCTQVPPQADVIVGPEATRLAVAFDLPVRWPGEAPPIGTFVAPIGDGPMERAWLAAVRGDRRLHLVVGGECWRGLLFERPEMLSSAGATSLCETLRLAAELDVAVGVTRLSEDHFGRPNPVALAVAVRAQLPVVERG